MRFSQVSLNYFPWLKFQLYLKLKNAKKYILALISAIKSLECYKCTDYQRSYENLNFSSTCANPSLKDQFKKCNAPFCYVNWLFYQIRKLDFIFSLKLFRQIVEINRSYNWTRQDCDHPWMRTQSQGGRVDHPHQQLRLGGEPLQHDRLLQHCIQTQRKEEAYFESMRINICSFNSCHDCLLLSICYQLLFPSFFI